MKYWFRGKPAGLLMFVAIIVLVAGGLAWVTQAALRLEQEQAEARAQAELYAQLRVALWRLDSRVFPMLAREASRPYDHYKALYIPPVSLMKRGTSWQTCCVFQPSPLINEELPDWVLLHFQATPDAGWVSPQVLVGQDAQVLDCIPAPAAGRADARADRERLLAELRRRLEPKQLFGLVEHQQEQLANQLGQYTFEENQQVLANESKELKDDWNFARDQKRQSAGNQAGLPANNNAGNSVKLKGYDQEFQSRQAQRAQLEQPSKNFEQLNPVAPEQSAVEKVQVRVGPMAPLWLPIDGDREILVLARIVHVGQRVLCQGIVIDWPRLEATLRDRVSDLFPSARILPVRDAEPPHPERTMTALPLELDPCDAVIPASVDAWTPLRIGLMLAWLAAVMAIVAVGLGGWSLLDLSERRIRFVSAVTHELRTPLTTLRLYLDMLTSGMVKEERHREEYLHTLHSEADRLHRLIGNVLDFSRLENHRTRPEKARVMVGELVDQVRTTWADRCRDAGKELVVERQTLDEQAIVTDSALVQQIVGNLIDNACKYSRHAEDPRVWLRVSQGGTTSAPRLCFEVEDRGPGVSSQDRAAIFRPFRRGRCVDPTSSGVGLGLALAQRWAGLLGGALTLCTRDSQAGACFRLELPI